MTTSIIISKVYIGKETENRLVTASEVGDLGSVYKLLRKKVNPNIRNEVGVTPLARACAGGFTEIVKLLIESGSDVNITIPSNVSPLHLAAKGNHTETVKHLILAGANLDAHTVSGVRPIDLTRVHSDTWYALHEAKNGELPVIEDFCEVPEIPDFAIGGDVSKKKKAKGGKRKKGSKKGKKGSKKSKKKGKKKK